MLMPRRPPGWPQPKVEHEPAPDYGKDAAWIRKQLSRTGGYMYFSAGEADPELYSRLEEDFKRAKDEHNADISMVAGPVISIPAVDGLKKRQEGREYLSPVVRLAKEEKILLYPADKRLAQTFRIFSDIEAANIEEPHAPGEKPGAAKYIYNWWIEYAPFETEFYLATSWKKPVTKDFTEHFLFLTDAEIADLRKWMSSKSKDAMKLDLATCREFWEEHSH